MLYELHLVVFLTTAVLCFVALAQARQVTQQGTRTGLVWLLGTSGAWSLSYVGYLLAPTAVFVDLFYLVGLTIGFATVGAWLYFCSAYTGRSFHRLRTVRMIAVVTYVAVVTIKLTNPIHGQYYTLEPATVPFAHLAVQHAPIHWFTTGVSYTLAGFGLFLLFEKFLGSEYDTRPLGVLTLLTALPIVFDVVGFMSDLLLGMIYSPLGVAVFAIGVLFVYRDQFVTVQLADDLDEASVFLDDNGRIRNYNRQAVALFPELEGARDEALTSVVSGVPADGTIDEKVIERPDENGHRYYLASKTSFDLGASRIGQLVLFTDVTKSERQRRELKRQNNQLHDFAEALTHELRNTLTIIDGHVSLAGSAISDGDINTAKESLKTASSTSSRMGGIVDDLSVLAKYGQTVKATETVDVSTAAKKARAQVDTDGLELAVEGNKQVLADDARLRAIFQSAYEFFERNGATAVRVDLTGDELVLSGDGHSVIETNVDEYFEYGSAVPTSEAGVALPNVEALSRVHGWSARIDTEYEDGVRVVIDTNRDYFDR